VATGLMFPIGLDFGADGGLYVAMPAVGADNGGGTISRIEGMGTPAAMAASSDCAPVGAATPAA
jgi:3-deoxy-D-arabino-heptulosonate 7-phosphate (DAHP) synthase